MNYWINKIRQDEILGETGYIVKQSVFSNYLFIFGFKLKQKLLSTNKKINFEGLITSRFSLNDINIAINTMRSGSSSGRIMIDL